MSVTHPAGFTAAGVEAGLKTSGGKDMALVVNTGPDHDSASVFTANRCKANPILWSQEVVKDGIVRAVVLNSGGANCYTGAEGFQTTHAVAERVAEGLGIGALDVVVCSTGLIGLSNPRKNLAAGRRRLHRGAHRRRRYRCRRGDHDHRLGEQAGRRRGQRLVDRRDGQGRRHAGPAARDHARRTHDGRSGPRSRPRHGPARGDRRQLRPARLRRLHVDQRHRDDHGQRSQRRHPAAGRLRRGADPGLHRPRDAAAQGRRGRRPRDRDHRPATPPRRPTRSRSAAASPAATCSRPPSSARTPTGAASWPASVRRARPSTPPTSTSR